MYFTIAGLIFFQSTKQQWASFKAMAGKCILTLWLTTLCPVAHAICSSQWLCSAPHWLTYTPRALPWAFWGEREIQSATNRFQMASTMQGSEDERWKEDWFPLWSMTSHALERSSPDTQKRLWKNKKKHLDFFYFFISISFVVKVRVRVFSWLASVPKERDTCIHKISFYFAL